MADQAANVFARATFLYEKHLLFHILLLKDLLNDR